MCLQDLLRHHSENSFDGVGGLSIGKIDITFLYDTDLVMALKMLPPTQRSYEPSSKTWSIDLFALPDLLEHLTPLGYKADDRLQEIARLTDNIERTIFCFDIQRPRKILASNNGPDALKAEEEQMMGTNTSLKAEPKSNLDAELIKILDSDNEENPIKSEVLDVHSEILEKTKNLESMLQRLVNLVGENDPTERKINLSDCGRVKRRRLTLAQIKWRSKQDSTYIEYKPEIKLLEFVTKQVKRSSSSSIYHEQDDCDCGQPWKRQGGVHTCRYFGHFDCSSCGNTWTTAYCWKGETQACRRCETENLPLRKDNLDGRKGRDSGGHHDSSRCGRCLKLGYNCNLF